MDKTQILLFAVVFAVLLSSLYRKYIKKNKKGSGTNTKTDSGSSFSSSSKDDDYEPYSKK